MKAQDLLFTKIVNGTTQFVIPVFQRDYSWTEEQCEQLWNDVVRVGTSAAGAKHFMGSLVYVQAGDTSAGFTRWLLIDGQQRMTTMTLLVAALRRHMMETNWKPKADTGPTPKKLLAYFLKNTEEEGDREYKVVLRRHDDAALRAVIDGTDMPSASSSRVVENYEFFRDALADVDPDVVYEGICRLVVVDVTLDRAHDDPQMIFESLNSTGVDLSQADLIRNYILMRHDEKTQTRLYGSYWAKIEAHYRDTPRLFDAFARDYMALHMRSTKQAKSEDIYREFRAFFQNRQDAVGVEEALQDMLRFSQYHAAFALGRSTSANLAPALARVNRLAEVAALLVMKLHDCLDSHKTLTEAQFLRCLGMLESYVFRRAVLGWQSRGYWQVFAAIAERVRIDDPERTLAAALMRQRDSYRFPRDDEFEEMLRTRDIYSMRTCHYLLERLENHESKEPSPTGSYSVEHVLPQNPKLSRPWTEMLGPDWKKVQQEWLHRLGNLTLTGYNSTYSDRPFAEKKTIPGGFSESSVRLNKYIRDQDTWTAVQMEARGRALAAQALTIWQAIPADEAALREAQQEDLKRQAAKLDIGQVEVTEKARPLFDEVRTRVLAMDPSIIEVPRRGSVSYHAADGDFFLEVLPRKHRVILLLGLELAECELRDDRVRDTADHKFIANATNWGGVFYNLNDAAWVEAGMTLVRQAHGLAAQ